MWLLSFLITIFVLSALNYGCSLFSLLFDYRLYRVCNFLFSPLSFNLTLSLLPYLNNRLQSSNSIAEEKCSYCLASVPFESPEVAFCQGKGHKLARCAVSMVVCPTTPLWFCMCCHRRAFKLAPEKLFVIPGPQCPFCGILLQRLQPDFLLSASPT